MTEELDLRAAPGFVDEELGAELPAELGDQRALAGADGATDADPKCAPVQVLS